LAKIHVLECELL
jgi:hypothetical protein